MICSSGSITLRKDGRYMGKFYYFGKPYYVYGKSKQACQKEMPKKKKEIKESLKNSETISKTMYLNTWFYYWINTFKRQSIKESTYLKYLDHYKRYADETIGKQRINAIDAGSIQKFINNIKAYSAQKFMYQVLNDLFDILQKQNYIKSNPMALVVMPKKNKDDKPETKEQKLKILTYQEEIKLLEELKKSKATCYNIVKFNLYTGLRRGEALGLTWKDVNLDKKEIKIGQQWSNITKNKHSI